MWRDIITLSLVGGVISLLFHIGRKLDELVEIMRGRRD